jgi:hypothetical protein
VFTVINNCGAVASLERIKRRGDYNKVAGARNNVDTELYFMLNVNEIMITADHS